MTTNVCMINLVAVAGGLLGAMLLVGGVLYLALGGVDFQWEDTPEPKDDS